MIELFKKKIVSNIADLIPDLDDQFAKKKEIRRSRKWTLQIDKSVFIFCIFEFEFSEGHHDVSSVQGLL